MDKKACILGSGAWAGALAIILSDNGFDVTLWARNSHTREFFSEARMLPKLPGICLPDTVNITGCADEGLSQASLVVSAIPSSAVSSVANSLAMYIPPYAFLVSATKGFDYTSLKRPSQVWVEANPELRLRTCVLSGPNFAKEIAGRLPAATVVAGEDESARLTVQKQFMTPYFRVYSHDDVVGVEVGGALKNVIALACGMVEGMELGDNARAAIISRGLAEMVRLGVSMGAEPLTFSGLSGLGDLVLTSTGKLSRNRQAGVAVGRGQSITEFIEKTGYTVEGFQTVRAARDLSLVHQVRMPITDVVYRILYEGMPVSDGVSEIMNREAKPESEPFFR
ncbi:MAG: NAD(P)H-dependent glycerol-3-phosphate dehydrogenase [Bacillota bacterium]